mmetsp:Transcript_7206/g.44841  ORF Transcript_7206/g.44841 Transcript_7206/m.44841 type:complete len:106 (+) Transcript_7206:1091-1408(+)
MAGNSIRAVRGVKPTTSGTGWNAQEEGMHRAGKYKSKRQTSAEWKMTLDRNGGSPHQSRLAGNSVGEVAIHWHPFCTNLPSMMHPFVRAVSSTHFHNVELKCLSG